MCEYSVIAPPYILIFSDMSKKELDKYFNWYLEQIPIRIAILEKAIKGTSGFEDWKMDYSPESLDKLGEWFAKQVETKERAQEKIKEMKACLAWPASELPVPKYELTNKTFSLAIDIGMYISQVMLKNIPGLKWEHNIEGSKKWIDYGQPGLSGFGKIFFNPTRIILTFAYGLIEKTFKGNRLRELYEIWKKYALA
jgi:hypothetical protein